MKNQGISFCFLTYEDKACFGIQVDPTVVPESRLLINLLDQATKELMHIISVNQEFKNKKTANY